MIIRGDDEGVADKAGTPGGKLKLIADASYHIVFLDGQPWFQSKTHLHYPNESSMRD
jgi:hypothetical protein